MSVLAILDFMAMMPFEKAKQSHSALLIMLGGCGLVSLDLTCLRRSGPLAVL